MSQESPLVDAIADRNVSQIRTLISEADFFVISVSEHEQEEEEVEIAAMTAEIGEFEALVAFTTEDSIGNFVNQRGDLFAEQERIDGVMVEGAMLLEYLPEGFGLLIDPESESATIIDPALAEEVAAS